MPTHLTFGVELKVDGGVLSYFYRFALVAEFGASAGVHVAQYHDWSRGRVFESYPLLDDLAATHTSETQGVGGSRL